ncbi:MAG TPA: D-alanyl-D-alanine carboxypeptidase family protein [Solirubrobacteraceae bacterium]|nr:D-alanyl-D-alanine carboxypeptidase family protein [Solirubrobacteraceae bacterium]
MVALRRPCCLPLATAGGRRARGAALATATAIALAAAGPARAADPPPPALSARAAILVERDLGTTIYARRADVPVPVASETKLMTAYVALARAPLTRILTALPYTPTGSETVAGLRAGQRLSVGALLSAMLLPSGADAADALAIGLAGSNARFVGWMNRAARALHLRETHFATDVGLDTPGNYSSARDLATLTAALLRNPFFARTVARSRATLPTGLTVVNRNDLVGRYAFVVGVKTGHTNQAGYCLVGAGRQDGVNVISVELGDPSEGTRDADTLALLRYGLSLYHTSAAVRPGRVYATLPVGGRPGERAALVAARGVRLVLRHGARLDVYPTNLAELARGPLRKGTVLGQLAVMLDGRAVARVPLVTRGPLAAPPARRATTLLLAGGLTGGALLGLFVGCSLLVMFKRRGER